MTLPKRHKKGVSLPLYFYPTMADDQKSAKELREYHKGGSIPSDQLSASQLRARESIRSNNPHFSTGDPSASTDSGGQLLLVSAVAVGLIAVVLAYVFGFVGGK